MDTVWLLPAGTDSAPGAGDGDFLIRPAGEELEVAALSHGGVEWLGSLPASLVPEVPAVTEPSPAADQAALLMAVRGVQSALVERGG
jgi:hypothetical protein